MVASYFEGNTKEATHLQLATLPLINSLFCEVNPIPVKAALNMLGYDFGVPRLPLVELSKAGKERLQKEMKEYGLLS